MRRSSRASASRANDQLAIQKLEDQEREEEGEEMEGGVATGASGLATKKGTSPSSLSTTPPSLGLRANTMS